MCAGPRCHEAHRTMSISTKPRETCMELAGMTSRPAWYTGHCCKQQLQGRGLGQHVEKPQAQGTWGEALDLIEAALPFA